MKIIILIPFMIVSFISSKAQISRYSGKGVEQTLEQNVPLPFEELYGMAKAKYELEMETRKAQSSGFKEYYKSISYFKDIEDGTIQSTIIVDNFYKSSAIVKVKNRKIVSIETKKIFNESNGLKITSEIKNAYNKVFLENEGKFSTIELYFPSLFLTSEPSKTSKNFKFYEHN